MAHKTIDVVSAFVPFSVTEKSKKDSSGKDWLISGYASTPDKDFDGEVILPSGIDYENYFKDNGWITYEHGKNVEDIIGEPTDAYTDDDGFHISAKLYKESKRAQDVWSLQRTLNKESSSGRSLGFSIEGVIRSRDPRNPKIVTGVQIKNVTVTSHPANRHATVEVVTKSVDVGTSIGYEANPNNMSGISALQVSSVADAITLLTYTMSRDNKDDILAVAQKSLEDKGLLNRNSLELILQLGRGISREQAQEFFDKK